jgi:thiamine-phosphate pyrophosphorylase
VTPRLVVITDPAFEPGAVVSAVQGALTTLPCESLAVQWRDKRQAPDLALARALREATRGRALFVVNGDIELARSLGACGVHLGGHGGSASQVWRAREALGPSSFVSVAAHDDDGVRRAVADGADAALVSPIFATPGKGIPRGIAAVRAARRLAPGLSIYALGGVDGTNVASCLEAGATGVAVIRAVLAASNPASAAGALVPATC